MHLLLAHQSLPVPRADAINEDVPEGLSDVIHKMMAKKPEDRYQSADEVIAALQPFETAMLTAEPEEAAVSAAGGGSGLWQKPWFVPSLLGGAALFGLLAAVMVNWIKSTGR